MVEEICPHCGRPMNEHELKDDFIERIMKRSSQTCSINIKNIQDYILI